MSAPPRSVASVRVSLTVRMWQRTASGASARCASVEAEACPAWLGLLWGSTGKTLSRGWLAAWWSGCWAMMWSLMVDFWALGSGGEKLGQRHVQAGKQGRRKRIFFAQRGFDAVGRDIQNIGGQRALVGIDQPIMA